jgi:glyoxylase-like metal-dependent hydrolase (beta-lactamase superfamily II)/ferredoxin
MAQRAKAFPDQSAGSFFVDASCIDCGTCYQFAPETFKDAGEHSIVHRQPGDEAQVLRAAMALVSCPTGSIGSEDKAAVAKAAAAFPHSLTDDVAFCGYTSEKSFGAWSWLLKRKQGNVLMDSPRSAPQLMKGLEAQGGVSMLVLSHRDDVADHAAYAAHFGCPRVAHAKERLTFAERQIEGDEPIHVAEDLLLIPTPGHTAGSMCLLFKETYLFTGDHLWWNPHHQRLSASKSFNWHSWDQQLKSLERLLDFKFTWVLPGHGYLHQTATPAAMRADLTHAIAELKRL